MENFEDKYNEYIKRLKNEISYVLWEKHHDFEYNFEHDSISDSSFFCILFFVCGILGSSVTEHRTLPRIIFAVAWLGVGILYWIFNAKHKKAVSDYFFYKYEYQKIIEDRIKRDEQRDIKKLLDEMFGKDKFNIDDLDVYLEVYEFELKDIKYFYDRCLSKIKYERFEEKSRY